MGRRRDAKALAGGCQDGAVFRKFTPHFDHDEANLYGLDGGKDVFGAFVKRDYCERYEASTLRTIADDTKHEVPTLDFVLQTVGDWTDV